MNCVFRALFESCWYEKTSIHIIKWSKIRFPIFVRRHTNSDERPKDFAVSACNLRRWDVGGVVCAHQSHFQLRPSLHSVDYSLFPSALFGGHFCTYPVFNQKSAQSGERRHQVFSRLGADGAVFVFFVRILAVKFDTKK